MTYSSSIDALIAAAEGEGNHVEQFSTGWTKVREVIHMALPMSDELCARTLKKNSLRFWSSEATPHNRAEEGFTDDLERVSISFPRRSASTNI